MSTQRTFWLWGVSVLLAIVLLAALLTRIEPGQFDAALRTASPGLLALSVVAFMAMNAVRGLRFRLLSRSDLSWLTWWRLATLHMFFFTVVPFRLGELSFLPLARRLTDGVYHQAIPVMIVSRLFDVLVLLIVFALGVLALRVPFSLPGLALVIALFVLLVMVSERMVGTTASVVAWIAGVSGSGLAHRLSSNLDRARAWISENPVPIRSVFALSVLARLCGLAVFYGVLKTFGLSVDVWTLMFLYAGTIFVSALGFFSVASIGVAEAGLAGLLMLVGLAPAEALPLGVLARLSMVTVIVGCALLLELSFRLLTPKSGGSADGDRGPDANGQG